MLDRIKASLGRGTVGGSSYITWLSSPSCAPSSTRPSSGGSSTRLPNKVTKGAFHMRTPPRAAARCVCWRGWRSPPHCSGAVRYSTRETAAARRCSSCRCGPAARASPAGCTRSPPRWRRASRVTRTIHRPDPARARRVRTIAPRRPLAAARLPMSARARLWRRALARTAGAPGCTRAARARTPTTARTRAHPRPARPVAARIASRTPLP